MKLINGKIDEFLDNDSMGIFGFEEEEEQHSPCWEVKIDREDKKAMIFLIDGKEKLSCSLSKLDKSFLTIEKISELIAYLRQEDFDGLRKVLGMKKRGR